MFRPLIKRALNYNTIKNFYRSYVSFIDIHVDKVKSVKIKPEFDCNESDSQIKVEVLDGDKNLIKLSSVAKISQTEKKFNLETFETNEDMTFIVELPINVFNDVEINASAVKGLLEYEAEMRLMQYG